MKKTKSKCRTKIFNQITFRYLSLVLAFSMVLSLVVITPMTAKAIAYVQLFSFPTKIIYKVGESFDTSGLKAVLHDNGKETDVSDKIPFYTSKTEELTQGYKLQTVGKKIIEIRYNGFLVGSYAITVSDPNTGATASSWPFVPSNKNMTSGKIPSGWAYIISHDDGKFRVNGDKTVTPSRRFNDPFYFEHLGNDRYYIHAAYGGYLSYKGNVTDNSAPIVISDTPCKWFLDAYNEGGYRTFAIAPDVNHKYVIRTWGLCYENQDSRITLHNTRNGDAYLRDCRFIISTQVPQNTIPQWWFDYKDGKSAPTGKVEKPEDDGYGYYDKLEFDKETKLPVTTTSINYNLELPEFNSSFPIWASTVKGTLLSKNERGTYLEAYADGEYVEVSKYSASGDYLGAKYIKYELPIFGAIFSGKEYNYIAFGQENKEENDSKESIRIVKYDKEFNRISSVSVKGEQTKATIPLNHTAHFAENGNQLILHTARTRYKSSDGLNHQSNLDIYVNTDTMKVTYVSSLFPSNHVSHSFDTYVRFDDNVPVFLDHGDASPRSVVLQKAVGSSYKKATMFEILGPSGANYTGVTVGGFEVSENNYLTAIASINQSAAKWKKGNSNASLNSSMLPSNVSSLTQRDIVLCILPRNFNNGATAKKITIAKYIGTTKIATTPQLIKVNNNKFAVLWAQYPLYGGNYNEDDEEVPECYAVQYIDENGNKLGNQIVYKNLNDFYAEYKKNLTNDSVPSNGIRIVAHPAKTIYKVGDGFDITGFKVMNYVNGKETNVNDKITFYTSKVVELTQGRKFTTTGTKVVEIRYEGKKIGEYKITVSK